MKTFSTKEMIAGLNVSTTSLYDWIKEGLPVLRQSPYIFTLKSLKWIVKNKVDTDFETKAQEMTDNASYTI